MAAAAFPHERGVAVLESVQIKVKLEVGDDVAGVVAPDNDLVAGDRLGGGIEARVDLVTDDGIGNVFGGRGYRYQQNTREQTSQSSHETC